MSWDNNPGVEAGRTMTAALDQVITLYALTTALDFGDFAKAERAVEAYVDASIETLRGTR